jgi:hypothetical protein
VELFEFEISRYPLPALNDTGRKKNYPLVAQFFKLIKFLLWAVLLYSFLIFCRLVVVKIKNKKNYKKLCHKEQFLALNDASSH